MPVKCYIPENATDYIPLAWSIGGIILSGIQYYYDENLTPDDRKNNLVLNLSGVALTSFLLSTILKGTRTLTCIQV